MNKMAEKDNFFDACVIIGFGLYTENINNLINKKCYKFIIEKNSNYLVCHAVIRELNNFIGARRIIIYEVINKIKDITYEIGKSEASIKNLSKNEINKAKQLYEKLKDKKVEQVSEMLISELTILEVRIDQFLKFKVDEKVILIDEILNDLVSMIHDLVDNYSDCRVLASAIQEQEKRAIFLFVTKDKEHFNPNAYEFIKEDPRFEGYKFPELKNLYFD